VGGELVVIRVDLKEPSEKKGWGFGEKIRDIVKDSDARVRLSDKAVGYGP
jgi:hypothetical protein